MFIRSFDICPPICLLQIFASNCHASELLSKPLRIWALHSSPVLYVPSSFWMGLKKLLLLFFIFSMDLDAISATTASGVGRCARKACFLLMMTSQSLQPYARAVLAATAWPLVFANVLLDSKEQAVMNACLVTQGRIAINVWNFNLSLGLHFCSCLFK